MPIRHSSLLCHMCRCVTVLVLSCLAERLVAAGGSLMPLSMLTNNAEAIVVGKIVQGSFSNGTTALTIEVEKALKGTILPNAALTFEAKVKIDPGVPTLTIHKERGIFFLQRVANGGWAALPLVTGRAISIRAAYFALSDSAKPKVPSAPIVSPLERVFAEVLGSLDSPDGQAKGSPCDLQMEYRLLSSKSLALKQMFAEMSSSPRVRLSRAALYAGVTDAEESALARLQQRAGTMTEPEIHMAARQLQYVRSATPGAIAQLGIIAATTTGKMKFAALGALARIHDRQSVVLLAPYLDSLDLKLAGLAVDGISRFANNVPAGEHHPKSGDWKYRTEDTMRYSGSDEQSLRNNPTILSFWKAWWNQHRAEIAAAHP